MNLPFRLVISFIFVALTIVLFAEGLELWSLGKNVDGDGIGIHFLGVEISDRVPESNVPLYSIGFFVTSLVSLLICLVLIGKTFLEKGVRPL